MGLLTQRYQPIVTKFCSLKWQTQTHTVTQAWSSAVYGIWPWRTSAPPTPQSITHESPHAHTRRGSPIKFWNNQHSFHFQFSHLSRPPISVHYDTISEVCKWGRCLPPCHSEGVFYILPSQPLTPSVSLLHPDYQETPISKRHLNSDVNVLIRSVNELKAAQIKLMQP